MAKHKKKGRKNGDEEENGKAGGFGLGISQETSNSIAGIFCFHCRCQYSGVYRQGGECRHLF